MQSRVTHEKAQITLAAVNGYDAAEFIEALTAMKVLPHVAQNISRRKSAVPDSVTKSDGHTISQQKHKLIEQGFGWAKFIGPIRQVMVRILKKAAYKLTRMYTSEKIRLRTAGWQETPEKQPHNHRKSTPNEPFFKLQNQSRVLSLMQVEDAV